MTPERRAALEEVVESAQRVAGLVAARGRGDKDGARALLTSFDDERQLASGALLVAELSLGLYGKEAGLSLDECVNALCVEMETSLSAR